MNLLNYLFNVFFQRKNENLNIEEDLGEDELRQFYLKQVLLHLDRCLKYPSKMKEKYETLKENFSEIINNPHVDSGQFKEYIRLLYPEMDRKGDWQEGISYLKMALTVRGLEADILESYLWLSLLHSYISDYKPAMEFARKSIESAKKLNDNLSLTMAMQYLARIYRSQGKYKKSIWYYDKVIKIAQRNNNEEKIAHAYGSKGLTYWHMNEYENGLHALKTAQDMFIRLKDERHTGHTFNNMGLIYTELGLYPEALRHFEKAVVIAKEREDVKEFGLTEGNIGMVYFFLKQYDTALTYLKRTMQTMDKLQSKYRLAKAKTQIAWIYRNSAQDINTLQTALNYAEDAYEIGLRYHIIHFQIIGASYQAIILKDLLQINEAISFSRRAVKLLDKVKVFDGLEEEIYFNHYLILGAIATTEAIFYLEKSYKEVLMKLGKIANSNFKKSYLSIELHKRILDEIEKYTN